MSRARQFSMMHPSETDAPAEKQLFLCIDGVPHTAIERSRAQGRFQLFRSPTRVVAPFPAMTNVALKELFGAASPPGYEAFYFDRERNRLSGGIRSYLQPRTRSLHIRTYHDFVDYQEPIHFEFLVYAMPERVFRADLGRFLAQFETSRASRFVGYLKSTDGLIHMGGQQQLDWALRVLDEALTSLIESHQGKLEITMFSDHGNSMVGATCLRLKDHFRRQDFHVGSRLGADQSVVVPAFGPATYAAIYTIMDPAQLVADLTQLEGVDFAIYRQDHAVVVTHQAGQAKIMYDPMQQKYCYETATADPLRLRAIRQQLKDQGQLDAQGFADDRVWFEATADHDFPDILHRLHQAMGNQVTNPADILLSLKDGIVVGNAFFDGFAELAAIHGGAQASSSIGFLMSTHRNFPTSVRASDVQPYLRLSGGRSDSR